MKQKIALFIDPSDAARSNPRPMGVWADSYPDEYIRITEFVEVEFPERKKAGEAHVAALRAKREAVKDEMVEKLAKLEDLIKTVSALPDLRDV
jgi:hypothetical protein